MTDTPTNPKPEGNPGMSAGFAEMSGILRSIEGKLAQGQTSFAEIAIQIRHIEMSITFYRGYPLY